MKKTGGIGFCSLLTLIFVVFKLLGKITWSWWWVFAPLWIGGAVVVRLVSIFLVLYVVAHWNE